MRTPQTHVALDLLHSIHRDLIQIQNLMAPPHTTQATQAQISNALKQQILQRSRHYFKKWWPEGHLFPIEHAALRAWPKQLPSTYWILESLEDLEGFIRQSSAFAIRLTCVKQGVVTSSAMVASDGRESWVAERNGGVRCNERRIRFTPSHHPLPSKLLIGLIAPHHAFHQTLNLAIDQQIAHAHRHQIRLMFDHKAISNWIALLSGVWDGAIITTETPLQRAILQLWAEASNLQCLPSSKPGEAASLNTTLTWFCETRLPWSSTPRSA